MTTQEQIEFIKQKAIEANPDIKKLEFGCKVSCRFDEIGFPNEGSLEYHPAIQEIGYVTHDDFLEICHHFQDLPISDIRDGYLGEDYEGMFCEIIGRDIRLADVLRAIDVADSKKEKRNNYCVTTNGGICTMGYVGRFYQLHAQWNLLKDRLEDQSNETIEFIYNLLK